MKWYEDPEYQSMCEKAGEIQEIARKNPPAAGACLLRHLGQSSICVDEQGRFFLNGRESRIYLPSQEDLQEMLLLPPNTLCPDILTILRLFNVFAVVSPQFTSMNQLWLAFVYHELYQKKWNPEKKEWEKIK